MKKKASAPRVVPWRTGVSCQRFFSSRAASGYFEVGRGTPASVEVVSQVDHLQAVWDQQTARHAAAEKRAIEVADERKEPNPWVERTGWARHLKGLAPDRLRKTIEPVQDDERGLAQMLASLDRVLDRARQVADFRRVGLATLFEAERKEVSIKPPKPLDNRLEDTTWARYKSVFQKLLCYLVRVEEWDEEARPPYQFTTEQGDLFDAFQDAAEAPTTGPPFKGNPV